MNSRHIVPLAATLAVSVLAACGGGGSSSPSVPSPVGGIATSTPMATAAPTASPTAAASAAPAAAPLGTAQLGGAAGFVNAQSHTVYVFDADLAAPGTSVCSGSCASVWPPVAASAGVTYPTPFTAIKRADGTLQLAYSGRPVYTYIGDAAAGSIAGNGLVEFGGAWHIARPAGTVSATPTPSPSPSTSAGPVGY
jgi:predicted lipoprotein with Yx(FWY)xxD motif